MSTDSEFYNRRIQEELQLADAANSAMVQRLHVRRADEYGRLLGRSLTNKTRDALTQWKLRKRSEVFGDWLADVL